MFASKVIIVVSLACIGITSAQVISSGSCPNNINVVPDFNVEKYLGTWYEYAKYPVSFENGGKCITAEYTLQADGNVGVTNNMINEKTDAANDIKGYAQVISNGKLLVTFPVTPIFKPSSNYWILDTDYTSYSVVYSCQPFGLLHYTTVWILTRERVPSTELVQNAKAVLSKNGVSLKELQVTNQSNC